jgi:hypothetical protein
VLDAVRMSGRWIRRSVLDLLTARTEAKVPPSRRQLVQEFCRLIHWRNRQGALCLSSANVCLNRLEKQGLVRLPPPAQRKGAALRRKLRDDGQPLPPLPSRLGSAKDVRLVLIADSDDPQHLVWNRLISREHPLKDAPLVGAQLRYLIVAGEQDILGAIGFGPPAFHLSCRDCWIGWDADAMAQNRTRVVGLSRFLIRPGIRCPNLASRSYGMVLKRVREDWFERYGIKPVLVETYVDRSTHTGKSLAAANWLRIGQSQGRGRSTPGKADRPQSVKDVWVWQWEAKARERLQQRSLPIVAPRSVFSFGQKNDWVEEELDGLDLGHAKLNHRFLRMLHDRWAHPERSFFASFGGRAGGKAAYAFIKNPRAELAFSHLLAPHWQNTRRRMAAESVVLLAQDTSTLSYNSLKQTTGLGPIGDERHPGRGLLLHTLQAFRLDGIPLGAAWAHLWARESVSDTAHRNEQSIDQKESVRWVNAFQKAAEIARQMPQTLLLCCGDRESDLIDLYDRSTVAPSNLFYLVRAQHDRVLASGEKLSNYLAALAPGGTITVQIPRSQNRPARTAVLQLRWDKIQIRPPRVGCKNSWGLLELGVLQALEIDPLPGTEPIQWTLLTKWKIDSLKTARRLIRWYGVRWGIECWHQVLKDVCKVETRQMKSAEALSRALGLDMIVAWRVLLLCRLGKEHPHLPASLLYSPEELAILEVLKKKTPPPASCPQPAEPEIAAKTLEQIQAEVRAYQKAADPTLTQESAKVPASLSNGPSKSSLTLWEANCLTAQLAGFWGRKADGHPGPDVLGRGLLVLSELVRYERIKTAQQLSAARNPSRKPG